MKWCRLANSILSFTLLPHVSGFGTTVSIAVSYCPATYSTFSTLSTTSYSQTSTPSANPEYLLYLSRSTSKRSSHEYVSPDGAMSPNPVEALVFRFTASGELMSGSKYVSTSGLIAAQRFEPLAIKSALATKFLLQANNTLSWSNSAFTNGQAGFCSFGSVIQVYFFGEAPTGCDPVQLKAVLKQAALTSASNLFSTASSTATYSSTTTITVPAHPSQPSTVQGNLTTADPLGCYTSSASFPALSGPLQPVTTLEQCSDYCTDFHYFGVQNGNQCFCGNSISPNADTASNGACNIACPGNDQELCGGTAGMAIYVISVKASSSTVSATASNTAATTTNSATSTPASTGTPNCYIGSEFDGTINGGYLILCNTEIPGTELSAVPAQSLSDCIDQCNSYTPTGIGVCVAVELDVFAPNNPCHLKSNIGVIHKGNNVLLQGAIIVDQTYAPEIIYDDPTQSSSSSSTYTVTSTSSSFSVGTTSTVVGKSSSWSSTSTSRVVVLATSTTISVSPAVNPTSFVISPYVSSPTSSAATVVSSSSRSGTTSVLTTTSLPASTVASSLMFSSPSRTTTLSGSTTASTLSSGCQAIPTTSSLCPVYEHQFLNVNNDGVCYEIRCSRALTGTQITGNATNAVSLKACISFCTLQNVAVPYQCVAVEYLTTSASPNCYLYSEVTGESVNTDRQVARLIYAGYSGNPSSSSIPSTSMTSSSSESRSIISTTSSIGSSSSSSSVLSTNLITTSISPEFSFSSSTTIMSTSQPSSSSMFTSTASPSTATPVTSSTTSSGTPSTATTTATTATTRTTTSPSSTSSSQPRSSSTASASMTTTSATRTTTTTTTTSVFSTSYPPYSATPCPAAPQYSECPGSSPTCYSYTGVLDTSSNNYEVECGTEFRGSTIGASSVVYSSSLTQCIGECMNDNSIYGSGRCVGVTFDNSLIDIASNCYKYNSLSCARRGNATLDSARLLYNAYPAMTDYASSFDC